MKMKIDQIQIRYLYNDTQVAAYNSTFGPEVEISEKILIDLEERFRDKVTDYSVAFKEFNRKEALRKKKLKRKPRKGDVVIYPRNKDMQDIIGVVAWTKKGLIMVEHEPKLKWFWLTDAADVEVLGRL